MNHLEIEYKTMLTEDEHKRLLIFFDHVQPIFQVNYYIDSADFALREARMALRVRTTPDAAELPLSYHFHILFLKNLEISNTTKPCPKMNLRKLQKICIFLREKS